VKGKNTSLLFMIKSRQGLDAVFNLGTARTQSNIKLPHIDEIFCMSRLG
jgi:hypothetical protein